MITVNCYQALDTSLLSALGTSMLYVFSTNQAFNIKVNNVSTHSLALNMLKKHTQTFLFLDFESHNLCIMLGSLLLLLSQNTQCTRTCQ